MEKQTHLRDLLYLDEEKAASIYSQLFGGLIEGTQESTEDSVERRRGLGLNIGPVRPDIGSVSGSRTSIIESRVLHHDLLLAIERGLEECEALVDLNAGSPGTPTEEELRATIGTAAYVRVEGAAIFEDYDRMADVAGEFRALVDFINQSALSAVEQSDEMKALRVQIDQQKQVARALPDKTQRNRTLKEIADQERAMEALVVQAVGQAEPLEDWFVDGLRLWIRTFLPGRMTLRIYPFESVPRFQVFGNLKRDAFVDADIGNLRFAYGTRPNVPLTLVGLITSLPAAVDDRFDPLTEFHEAEAALIAAAEAARHADEGGAIAGAADPDGDPVAYEKAFRAVFSAMETMENLVRFSRYPNLTVYPLAVYRRVPIAPPSD